MGPAYRIAQWPMPVHNCLVTIQLYHQDPALLEFSATVRSATSVNGHLEVTLDRTAFYPEGGGQPSDVGTLNEVPVVDVRKQDDNIVHVLEMGAAEFAAGDKVTGVVDEARRREYMQQHTGQHIISAALLEVGGYNTVSVHLGEEYSTIEVDAPSVSDGDLVAAEKSANAAIESAVAVTSTTVTDAEIGDHTLRRPPKVSGSIRLVMVDGVDTVACGGIHVDNSSQVRLVRLIRKESIRGRVRLYWKIGDRAIDHYRLTSTVVRELADVLSAQPHEIAERVRRQEERIRETETALVRERERVYRLEADGLLAEAHESGGLWIATASYENEGKDFLRGLGKALAEHADTAACLINHSGDQLQWCIVIGPEYGVQLNDIRDELLPVIDAKGGGKPPIWQGIGANPDGADEFLATFRRTLSGDRISAD